MFWSENSSLDDNETSNSKAKFTNEYLVGLIQKAIPN